MKHGHKHGAQDTGYVTQTQHDMDAMTR